ncbi:unnamed protein product, partial [Prorocentrum cordatum]
VPSATGAKVGRPFCRRPPPRGRRGRAPPLPFRSAPPPPPRSQQQVFAGAQAGAQAGPRGPVPEALEGQRQGEGLEQSPRLQCQAVGPFFGAGTASRDVPGATGAEVGHLPRSAEAAKPPQEAAAASAPWLLRSGRAAPQVGPQIRASTPGCLAGSRTQEHHRSIWLEKLALGRRSRFFAMLHIFVAASGLRGRSVAEGSRSAASRTRGGGAQNASVRMRDLRGGSGRGPRRGLGRGCGRGNHRGGPAPLHRAHDGSWPRRRARALWRRGGAACRCAWAPGGCGPGVPRRGHGRGPGGARAGRASRGRGGRGGRSRDQLGRPRPLVPLIGWPRRAPSPLCPCASPPRRGACCEIPRPDGALQRRGVTSRAAAVCAAIMSRVVYRGGSQFLRSGFLRPRRVICHHALSPSRERDWIRAKGRAAARWPPRTDPGPGPMPG